MFTLRRGEGRSPHYVYPRGGTHSAYHRITTRLQLTGNHNGAPKTVQKTEHHSALWTEPGISHGKNNRSPLPATPNSLPRLTPRPTRLKPALTTSSPPHTPYPVPRRHHHYRLRHPLAVCRPLHVPPHTFVLGLQDKCLGRKPTAILRRRTIWINLGCASVTGAGNF